MTSFEAPGLEVSGKVRARDIQMAAVADLRRRVLMISGAVDTVDQDVSMTLHLPEPGQWQIIKSETNLTNQTWSAMQVTTDEDTTFVDDADTLLLVRQFGRSFLTPELRRLSLYDGEVRPGEAVLMSFTLEFGTREPKYMHSRYVANDTDTPEQVTAAVAQIVADGMPQRPVIEVIVPVTVIG